MRTVFEVLGDVNNYQSLQFDDESEHRKYRFKGVPLKKRWKKPLAYTLDPTRKVGDFFPCWFGTDIFAMKKSVADKLGMYWQQSEELLPLPVEELEEELLVCHPLTVVNCLDMEKSRIDFETNWVKKHVFRANQLRASLFRLPAPLNVGVYCWADDHADPEEHFKSFVDKHHLKGLESKEVWSEK